MRRGRGGRPAGGGIRNGLHYLECWKQVWRVHAESQDEGDASPNALFGEGPPDLDGLLHRIEAYERRNPGDALVRFCRRPDVTALDCAILHTLMFDRVVCHDGNVGLAVLDVVKEATNAHGGLSEGLLHVRRLLPEAPLVAEGLVEVTAPEKSTRWLAHVCKPSETLVRWVLGDTIPYEAVCGTAPRAMPPFLRDPEGGDGAASDRSCEDACAAPLVLPPAAAERFERLVRMVRVRERCLDETGLGGVLPDGKGVALLLHGPPGTGKTLAARVLGRRLDKPVHLVASPNLVSKYFGETERNIARAFRRAEKEGAVLVLDEADSIVVDRSGADHTAYRLFTNALLRAVESTSGVVVFTTNFVRALDPALQRRLTLRIEIPRPEREERRAIWEALLPDGLPTEGDVDLDALAELDLTGGEIKNAVLAAVSEAYGRDPLVLVRGDLEVGIATATEERWTEADREPMGFRPRQVHAPEDRDAA